jgi:hypothetical protein
MPAVGLYAISGDERVASGEIRKTTEIAVGGPQFANVVVQAQRRYAGVVDHPARGPGALEQATQNTYKCVAP